MTVNVFVLKDFVRAKTDTLSLPNTFPSCDEVEVHGEKVTFY